ncbi:MAG: O-antigen ligase family protein, partial [Patescibacteria group bacterium]
YIFSHSFNFFIPDLYLWVRRSGVGEITQVVPGFNRIFMQSHIFVLIGFFILLFYLLKNLAEKHTALNKQSLKLIGLASLLLSIIIVSFSRSFWLGLAAGGLSVWLAMIFKLKTKLKEFIVFNLLALAVIILSLALTFFIIKFPYPAPAGDFNATNLLSDRATQITDEAGASSRWQLLPPLWQKIKAAPILGQGFGATVTYISSDPRVLSANLKGEYTTYAFEWGWLDVWLKLGIFGLLAYLALFAKLIFDGFKIGSYYSLSLAAGLIVVLAVNIFSPYVNHPLGIGCLIIAAVMLENLKLKNNF